MKYSQHIGIAAALLLVVACFLPWTYHPDLDKNFTGFFSEHNVYGQPGKVFIFFATVAILFFFLNKVWAKRWNLLVTALTLAFAIRTFIVYSGCYGGVCPSKLIGLWLMIGSALLMIAMAVLPENREPGEDSKK